MLFIHFNQLTQAGKMFFSRYPKSILLSLQVALCSGYIAVHAELEVLVVKLQSSLDPDKQEELADMNKCGKNTHTQIWDANLFILN